MMYAPTTKDYDEICKVVNKYTTGAASGEVELLQEAFHEKCTITGYLNGKLDILTMKDFYQLIDSTGPYLKDDYTARVDVINIEETTAIAHVVMNNWHGMNFSDYHSLIKENGEWKIIAKIYQQL